jgi:hypothetical protein
MARTEDVLQWSADARARALAAREEASETKARAEQLQIEVETIHTKARERSKKSHPTATSNVQSHGQDDAVTGATELPSGLACADFGKISVRRCQA